MPDAAPPPPPSEASTFAAAFSVFLHAGILVASALAMPALGPDARASIEQLEHLRTLLVDVGAAEPELEVLAATRTTDRTPDGEEPADSRCGESRGGTMGDPEARAADTRYGVQGPNDNADPHIGRTWGPDSGFFDGIGLDTRAYGAPFDTPRAPWGRDDALGNDPANARGATWGGEIGRAFGSPGIGSGLSTLCETCGHTGSGAFSRWHTLDGTATPTEPASLGRWHHLPGAG